jgi:hypothetical protein
MTASPFLSNSRSTLYRTVRQRVIFTVCTLGLLLQTVLTQTLPPPSSHKKTSKGPRALGLLELPPKGKAHLIPITILIDGKYYDASAYKAAPVPMALWSDTVYEAMRTGVSLGLFTVTGALQARDPNKGMQWMAEGTWQTASEVKAKAAKKAAPSIPRGMNDDEGPPVLLRRSAEKSKSADSSAAPTPTTQAQPAPTPAPPAVAPSANSPTPPASSSPAATVPSSQTASDDRPPEDKDRPALKRGKAGAASAEEAQKKAAADTSAKADEHAALIPANAPPASGPQSVAQAPNQIQLIPAISDSDGPDPLPYTYSMKPEEEEKFRKKMLDIAADEIRARAAALGASSATSPQPVRNSAQHGKASAAKPVQPSFEDVQLRVFDLADVNEPELVLMANARLPQSTRKGEASSNSQDLQYMITLVVREDVNGDLHKSLANVTDTQHLDVIPRLELIDAVDVDGDGRGELLFRQVSDAGSAFVIYRVIGDRLYPLFQGAPQ